jgi:PKD repeat protein
MDGFRENYNLGDKILNKLIKAAGWFLMIIGLLMLTPPSKADVLSPDFYMCPSNENWCLNFSFPIIVNTWSVNLTHVELDGIQGWDVTYLLVGTGGNITTDSDYSHNLTLTNYSSTYTKINIEIQGLTNITLREQLPDTAYSLLIDGAFNRTIYSDANGTIDFNESSSGMLELVLQESAGTPHITSWSNNYTADSSTSFTAERLSAIRFQASANQSVNWTFFNCTYVSGNGSTTGYCDAYFPNEGIYYVRVYGSNDNGQTDNWVNWTITVEDTIPPSAVSGLAETETTLTTITWGWTNPSDADFSHVMVYLDGVYQTNVSGTSWQATGLAEGTTYTITVYSCDVYNNCGNPASDSATTQTSGGGGGAGGGNLAPSADFTYEVNDLIVNFTDASTDSDGLISSWSWNFGDGNTSTAQNPSHTYADYGTYTVTLTVTDNGGLSDSVSKDVHLFGIRKPTTTATIEPVNETYFEMLTEVFGNESNPPELNNAVENYAKVMVLPYKDIMGNVVFVFLFGLPFLMTWLNQGRIIIPLVWGIILGFGMLSFLPPAFYLTALAIIAIGVTGIMFILYKKRG